MGVRVAVGVGRGVGGSKVSVSIGLDGVSGSGVAEGLVFGSVEGPVPSSIEGLASGGVVGVNPWIVLGLSVAGGPVLSAIEGLAVEVGVTVAVDVDARSRDVMSGMYTRPLMAAGVRPGTLGSRPTCCVCTGLGLGSSALAPGCRTRTAMAATNSSAMAPMNSTPHSARALVVALANSEHTLLSTSQHTPNATDCQIGLISS